MKRLYVLKSSLYDRSLGDDYYTYYIVFPAGNHAYSYTMTASGWRYNLLPILKTTHEVIELNKSTTHPDANIWALIKLYEDNEADEFQNKVEIAQQERLEAIYEAEEAEGIAGYEEEHKADFQSA